MVKKRPQRRKQIRLSEIHSQNRFDILTGEGGEGKTPGLRFIKKKKNKKK